MWSVQPITHYQLYNPPILVNAVMIDPNPSKPLSYWWNHLINPIRITFVPIAYRVLLGKQERRRPLGRPTCRWVVDNIRMDLQEVGCGYIDWIGLA